MVRASHLILIALGLCLPCPSFAEDQPHKELFASRAKQIQKLEQDITLNSATGDEKKLIQLARDSLEIADVFKPFSDLPIAHRCGFAAVRLSTIALRSAAGRDPRAALDVRQYRSDYLTLMPLCEQGLGLEPPAKPNLR